MAIDQIDRTVGTRELVVGPQAGGQAADRPRSVALGIALASMRTVVMVVLAALAILVLLPAAIAAQAAIGL